MKKSLVFALVAVMVTGLAVAASAALDSQWYIRSQVTALDVGQKSLTVQLGTFPGHSDAFVVGEDVQVIPPIRYVDVSLTGASLLPGDGVIMDSRSPLVMPGPGDPPPGHTWDYHVVIPDPGTPQPCQTRFWVEAADQIDFSTGGDPDLQVRLMDSTMTNTLFTFTSGMVGSQVSPNFEMTLNYVDSNFDNPDNTLWLVAEVVPEPGSLTVLCASLLGLAGFAVRRRR